MVSPLRPELPQAASHFPGTNNSYFHADIVSKSPENGCAIVHIFSLPEGRIAGHRDTFSRKLEGIRPGESVRFSTVRGTSEYA
jgi:hypothetical protein